LADIYLIRFWKMLNMAQCCHNVGTTLV